MEPPRKKKLYHVLKWIFSINGLVLTILLGILINSVSNFLQDKIQRQRYLELLQLEIRWNHSQAVGDIDEYKKNGIILNYIPFKTEVYEAGLQSGYLLTIDTSILARLYVLYSTALPKISQLTEHQSGILKEYEAVWEKCTLNAALSKKDWKVECGKEDRDFRSVEKIYSGFLYESLLQAEENLWEASEKFNPTQERLNSPLLRLLMGTGRLKIQE